MFDELSRTAEQEKISYRPTAWSKVDKKEAEAPKIIQMPDKTKHETEASLTKKPEKQSGGIVPEMFGVINYIRDMVKKNEDLLTIVIILLILADSDDNTELLIALAILFLPSVSGPFNSLFKK